MSALNRQALDRYITGNWGEDQYRDDDWDEPDYGEQDPADAARMEAQANQDTPDWWEMFDIDQDDRNREADRRPGICCAPEMCPTCWDQGGHAVTGG